MGKKYYIPANSNTVKWGYYNKNIPPILKIDPGDVVTIEVLTHHAGDAYDLMIKGDKNMEEIYEWTNMKKTINRRGMGDINDKSIGPGKGQGVHLITGPVYINGAKPGDILKVEILHYRENWGAEICSPKWLKQFIGIDTENSQAYNNGVDGISGATLSVNSLKYDLLKTCKALKLKL